MNFPHAASWRGRTHAEEDQRRERHHAALIAAIVCYIWQDEARPGPSVRRQPPRFSNITETTQAWHDFRYRSEELFPRLLRELRIPRRVVLRNGSMLFHGETARAYRATPCTSSEAIPT